MNPKTKDRQIATTVVAVLLLILGGSAVRIAANQMAAEPLKTQAPTSPAGVCPPFHLLDEDGNIINPVTGENADKPYSPKQTCGRCHDYEKITKGFHFTQGMGENPTAEQAARCLWASTPGNYGGNWCSPAPLYSYLSPKHNDNAKTMDLTSFTFITKGCASCHPGGGPMEFDRDGKRYDRWMEDSQSGLTSGGENRFDGDYHQARWSETGVLEADCLLCHMPKYDLDQRNKQLAALNFHWAATAGSKFARIKGSIEKSEPVEVVYNKELFNPDGTLEPHMVREPRNEACLGCHAQPSWKKRGANFSARTDVHLRAGLKCVDCHPAGSAAADPRIAGKEEHQFGKGDDPGGLVRNDLDDTMVTCTDCHDTGRMGAPVAKHLWLPPLHLEAIACQTCHIPERAVMPIEVQASDVFNTAPRIPSPGKRLWTFYGPDGNYRNHYGYLTMMGYDDKPTERFRPKLVRYKGQIYPANQIHSAWPGIEIDGETALMQPKMGDIVKMWTAHRADPTKKYPELAKIVDDNGDGVPEVNRPEEINALIHSVSQLLADIKYPMEKKRIVWVMDERVYRSGKEYRVVEKRDWEASPYANVHKYNHDIYPAKAAIGANGCADCHRPGSEFFHAPALVHRFDESGNPVVEPQYRRLGLSQSTVTLTAWCQAYVKPGLNILMLLFPCALVALAGGSAIQWVFGKRRVPTAIRWIPPAIAVAAAIVAAMLMLQPALLEYMLPTPMWLDANHFLVAAGVMLAGLIALLWELRQWISGRGGRRSMFGIVTALGLLIALAAAGAAGLLIFLKIPALDTLTRVSYTVFDASVTLSLALVIAAVLHGVVQQFRVVKKGHH